MPFRPNRYKTRRPARTPRVGRHAGLVKSGSTPSKARAIARARPTPLMSSVVSKVVNKHLETKYVAQDIALNMYVLGTLDGTQPNNRLMSVIPDVARGTLSHERIGQKINPTKLRVHCQYYFDTATQFDVVLKQVMITLKGRKALSAFTNANQITVLPTLIDNGDNTNSAISPGNDYTQLSYPYEKETVSKLKGDRTYVLRKNFGPAQSAGALSGPTPLTYGPGYLRVSFDVKCPKELMYENTVGTPTNFMPLWGVAGALVGSSSYNTALGTISVGTPANPIVRASCRAEMWYKDA